MGSLRNPKRQTFRIYKNTKKRHKKPIKSKQNIETIDTHTDLDSKSIKQARARHFDKKKKGPAPGDASATTKPSKFTKKFKQMYGEAREKYDSDKFFGGKGTPEQRTQLLKLQNKALRALGGSPKQKEIKKEIDALRKKMGMKVKEEVELNELPSSFMGKLMSKMDDII